MVDNHIHFCLYVLFPTRIRRKKCSFEVRLTCENNELYLFKFSQVKVYKFNESLLERYTKPGASNAIILLLIADTSNDLCVKNFKRDINLINEYVFILEKFFILIVCIVLEWYIQFFFVNNHQNGLMNF